MAAQIYYHPKTVLALSGSLRAGSLNTAMLAMAAGCAPPQLNIILYAGLTDLPLFNPDFEMNEPPSVARLRNHIAAADALLIASPEYAHGVSSVMKTALDWMVASGALANKPVVLWNAAPRAAHAAAALRETLGMMSARLVNAAGLELLIQHDAAGMAPRNPDPKAMRRALRVLKTTLDHLAQGR